MNIVIIRYEQEVPSIHAAVARSGKFSKDIHIKNVVVFDLLINYLKILLVFETISKYWLIVSGSQLRLDTTKNIDMKIRLKNYLPAPVLSKRMY